MNGVQLQQTESERLARNQAFWSRDRVARPLLGIAVNITFPLLTFSKQFADNRVTPDAIRPEDFFADWDQMFAETEARGEDLFMVASPFAGVPWMEAIAGCEIRAIPASGSMWAEYPDAQQIDMRKICYDPNNPWLKKLVECSRALRDHAAGRYPIGNPVLRGVSDIIAAILGPNRMVLEFYDHPQLIAELCERCTEIWHGVAEALTAAKGTFKNGSCADRRRVWGRGTSLLYQDDAVAVVSPRLFRQYFLPRTAEILRPYTNTIIHLHSATLPIVVKDLCQQPELKALEVLLDPTGRQPVELLDTFREILEHKALVICGDMTPEQIQMFLAELPPAGLCLQPKANSALEAAALL